MNRTERVAVAWLFGGDTGSSSQTLCQFLLLGEVSRNYVATPSDAYDFGRCHRLLYRVPGWRKRIHELDAVPAWKRLAEAWDELEDLYRQWNVHGLAFEKRKQIYETLHQRLKELTSVPPRPKRKAKAP